MMRTSHLALAALCALLFAAPLRAQETTTTTEETTTTTTIAPNVTGCSRSHTWRAGAFTATGACTTDHYLAGGLGFADAGLLLCGAAGRTPLSVAVTENDGGYLVQYEAGSGKVRVLVPGGGTVATELADQSSMSTLTFGFVSLCK